MHLEDQRLSEIEELVRLYELQLRSSAANFALWNGDGRQRSANALAELFFGLVRTLQPELCVEAGAKTGEVSLRMKQLSPNSRVVAFEANPYNFKKYSEEFRHDEKCVEYLNLALSDVSGPVTFNIVSNRGGKEVSPNTGSNSLLERKEDGVIYERVSVPATTLDQRFTNSKSAALWVDVEGASQQVLLGGDHLLGVADVILIEVEDSASWQGQWLSSDVMRYMLSKSLYPVARDFEYKYQHNILFLSPRALENRDVRLNIDYYFSALCKS